MPKKLHDALKKRAKKLFGTTEGDRAGAYIYGTMAKLKKQGKIK